MTSQKAMEVTPPLVQFEPRKRPLKALIEKRPGADLKRVE
jgi:hypothetical protein